VIVLKRSRTCVTLDCVDSVSDYDCDIGLAIQDQKALVLVDIPVSLIRELIC